MEIKLSISIQCSDKNRFFTFAKAHHHNFSANNEILKNGNMTKLVNSAMETKIPELKIHSQGKDFNVLASRNLGHVP